MLKVIRFLLLSLLIYGIVIPCGQKTPIKQSLDNPNLLTKEVVFEGEVSSFQFKVSKVGNAYTTFSLMDNDYNS